MPIPATDPLEDKKPKADPTSPGPYFGGSLRRKPPSLKGCTSSLVDGPPSLEGAFGIFEVISSHGHDVNDFFLKIVPHFLPVGCDFYVAL